MIRFRTPADRPVAVPGDRVAPVRLAPAGDRFGHGT